MDLTHEIMLGVIAKKVGLNIKQVEQEVINGTLKDRIIMCKGCRLSRCSRCQISFMITEKKTN